MLEKRPVTRDHLRDLINLSVRADLTDLVSANIKTFAEAPFEPGSRVWGLWDAGTPVGLMAMVHPAEYPFHGPDDDHEAAYLWRLMIAADHQGRGHGRAAIGFAVDIARGWGCPRLTAGVSNVPHSNLAFYERLGFRWTGRFEEGEKVVSMTIGEV